MVERSAHNRLVPGSMPGGSRERGEDDTETGAHVNGWTLGCLHEGKVSSTWVFEDGNHESDGTDSLKSVVETIYEIYGVREGAASGSMCGKEACHE